MRQLSSFQVCDGPAVEVNPVADLGDVPLRDLMRTIIGEEVDKLIDVDVQHLLMNGYDTMSLRNVGPASKKKILAAIEIGRRCLEHSPGDADPVRDPIGIARRLVSKYNGVASERLGATYLNARSVAVLEREVFVGTVNSCTVSAREIVRDALRVNATGVIVWHNHPSGDPGPSSEDIVMTRQIQSALTMFGVELVDHLILGANKFVSLKQRGVVA